MAASYWLAMHRNGTIFEANFLYQLRYSTELETEMVHGPSKAYCHFKFLDSYKIKYLTQNIKSVADNSPTGTSPAT